MNAEVWWGNLFGNDLLKDQEADGEDNIKMDVRNE